METIPDSDCINYFQSLLPLLEVEFIAVYVGSYSPAAEPSTMIKTISIRINNSSTTMLDSLRENCTSERHKVFFDLYIRKKID